MALVGFGMIAASGMLLNKGVFYSGVVMLGVGTGLSTVSNLSLMFSMTTSDKVGLFIGAWGMANAISRLLGSVIAGAVRDLVAQIAGNVLVSYVTVFSLMAVIMLVSLILLRRIDEEAFRRQAEAMPSLIERAAISGEGG